jgi:hypothetical protein
MAEAITQLVKTLVVELNEHYRTKISTKASPVMVPPSLKCKALELRAPMSLSRLWQQQGKQNEAHALLAGIYDWFTEGFDTLGLREARLPLEAV